ncbi:TRIC cation channel family protein [Bosea sp. TAF32]|uniref:TRIC cation channel family protein n=1 Tax=Bosea sp. TAF32 TaxID=3237482 RepID=UPI003F919114
MIAIETFVRILDLGGTFVLAISGAVAAVNRRLDIFGILVLSFVTGNFGDITRDVARARLLAPGPASGIPPEFPRPAPNRPEAGSG